MGFERQKSVRILPNFQWHHFSEPLEMAGKCWKSGNQPSPPSATARQHRDKHFSLQNDNSMKTAQENFPQLLRSFTRLSIELLSVCHKQQRVRLGWPGTAAPQSAGISAGCRNPTEIKTCWVCVWQCARVTECDSDTHPVIPLNSLHNKVTHGHKMTICPRLLSHY